MALIKQNDCFYLCDSHARDYMGMPCENGTAVVMKFDDISCLEQHLYSLSVELHSNLFELVPVQLIDVESENEKPQRNRKRKLALESDCKTNKEDLTKLKNYESKRKMLFREKDCDKQKGLAKANNYEREKN
ncbi:Hypothetical predicted protein [Paramuricea clavata]|uniref:Uncharacterized protein n=1 Tax=Paramuricea clavata TaxID=317549 RepID=A0A7D9D6P7_PARCT|nr:Hypothetical predicted protein [Paramuricea clavata]